MTHLSSKKMFLMFIQIIIIITLLTGCYTKNVIENNPLDQFRNMIDKTEYVFIKEKELTLEYPFLCYRLEQVETFSVEQKIQIQEVKETRFSFLPSLVLLPVAIPTAIFFNYNMYKPSKEIVSTSTKWKKNSESESVIKKNPLPYKSVTLLYHYADKDRKEFIQTDASGFVKKDLRKLAYAVTDSYSAPDDIVFILEINDTKVSVSVSQKMFISIYEYWSGMGFDVQ